ncbi:MAG: VWA domain-containing protein [Gammaproteobacteria bacterium]|nr:VWA domain-containing protein [Gammaproteobacteria bacterium]
MIELQWPWLLVALPLPWLVRYLWPAARDHSAAALKLPFADEMATLRAHGATTLQSSKWRWLLMSAIWLLLVLAAARPQWLGEAIAIPASGRDLMLAIDISGSMEVPDLTLDGKQTNRLEVVKATAGAFIARRQGDRLGLILFGRQAYLQTPLTFDRTTVQVMLNEAEIGLAGQETAMGDAIGLAVKRLRQRSRAAVAATDGNGSANSGALILLTDGANTAGEVEPLQAAQLAAKEGLRIYTIGVGAESMRVRSLFGSRTVNPSQDLDEKTLQAIADVTGGVYFRAKDSAALEQIYNQVDALEPVVGDEQTFRPVSALYPWPLAVALLLSAILALRYSTLFKFSDYSRSGSTE